MPMQRSAGLVLSSIQLEHFLTIFAISRSLPFAIATETIVSKSVRLHDQVLRKIRSELAACLRTRCCRLSGSCCVGFHTNCSGMDDACHSPTNDHSPNKIGWMSNL